jgi:hypothetical protein
VVRMQLLIIKVGDTSVVTTVVRRAQSRVFVQVAGSYKVGITLNCIQRSLWKFARKYITWKT